MIKTFDEYNKRIEEIDSFEREMRKLIDEWISMNFPELIQSRRYKDCFKFTKVDLKKYPEAKEMNKYFHINFNGINGGGYISLTKEKYKDLLYFIDNQELYRSAKKYNL